MNVLDSLSLKGKTALLTGGAGLYGRQLCQALCEAGADVFIASRNLEKLQEEADKTGAHALRLDLDSDESIASVVDEIIKRTGRIDILVNNAVSRCACSQWADQMEYFDRSLHTNASSLFVLTKRVGEVMKRQHSGSIINIGSVAGDAAYAGGAVYCATKAAVKILSDGLRIDLSHTPIRVTTLKPGLVETNFSNVRFHGDTERAANVYKGIQPLTGEDIADVALYAAQAPAHVQIAEVLILATHQASGSVISRH